MAQLDMNKLKKQLSHIEASYPDIACATFIGVYQDENGYEVTEYLDPHDILDMGHKEILAAATQIETGNFEYRVLTRNETRLGKEYHNEKISELDFTDRWGAKCTILELQWVF